VLLDKGAPGLPTIFPDITQLLSEDDVKACRRQLTLRNHSGELISLLTSKDELKIRIQSNQIAAIWPILLHIVSTLESKQNGGYKVQYTERLPIKELEAAIDVHFEHRN